MHRSNHYRAAKAFVAALACLCLGPTAFAQIIVRDIFGRPSAQRGITVVNWDGYMANPLMKFYVFPPTNAALPGSAILTANGGRLYFDLPSEVGRGGPTKSVSFPAAGAGVPVGISGFPGHHGGIGDSTLTIVFTDANGASQTGTTPIHILDLHLQRPNDFVVTENFDRDVTGFFADPIKRMLVKQAADDWSYFFAGMNLDPVPIGIETTYIWSNNFNGGDYFTNTNAYQGYQLYAYGTTNDAHRSGGEASSSGSVQTSGGLPLKIKRSGGFEAEIYGNYNTLGWLLLTDDNDWLLTGNLGDETNDFYSIAHHEIGHALIFNPAHPGFAAAKANGAFTSAAVTNYYGGPVPIDAVDHLNGVIDPDSGQGAFGYEYYGNIPRKRWTMTKIDLLCAREVGYVLRSSPAFVPLNLPIFDPLGAPATVPFSLTFNAVGGIPVYCWEIVGGTPPPGLTLDSYTGTLAGTPTTTGDFTFTFRVRDYHEGGAGITRDFTLVVGPPPPVKLTLVVAGQNPTGQAELSITGTPGQQQVLQVSADLINWTPVATNTTGASQFQFLESNPWQFSRRFYRAVVVP